ncbi:MAG: hypothetical protein ACRCZS_02295 [Chroococcidiopsis sp.]
MRHLNFPPLAEFEDRHNTIRPIYGTTIMGRYEFADRMSDIEQMLNEAPEFVTWESLYISQPRFRHAIDKALDCWGIDPDWLTPQHIEQLLFRRDEEPGWLIELSKGKSARGQGEGQTLAETLATISTHCQSLQEALDLANTVPADLLVEVLNTKAGMGEGDKPPKPQQKAKEQYLKDNFDELMARF